MLQLSPEELNNFPPSKNDKLLMKPLWPCRDTKGLEGEDAVEEEVEAECL